MDAAHNGFASWFMNLKLREFKSFIIGCKKNLTHSMERDANFIILDHN